MNSSIQNQELDDDSDTDSIVDTLVDLEIQKIAQEDDDEVILSMLEAQSSVLSNTQKGKSRFHSVCRSNQ